MDGNILVNEQGRAFEFEFLMPGPDQQRIVLPYIASLRRLGIHVHTRLVESAQWINLMQTFEFDAFIQGQGTSQPPTMMLPFFFHSSAADKPLTSNKAGIVDPVVDALIERAEQARTLEELTAACRALDRVLLWGFYNILISVPDREREVLGVFHVGAGEFELKIIRLQKHLRSETSGERRELQAAVAELGMVAKKVVEAPRSPDADSPRE